MQIFRRDPRYVFRGDLFDLLLVVFQEIERIAVKLIRHFFLQDLFRRIEAEDERIQNRILGALNLFVVDGTFR